MPYSNIVWVKLHLELFDEDDRFLYQLTERQQLLYIKLLYLAGRQDNKISKNPQLIIQKVNYQSDTQSLLGDISRIKEVFSKFRETKYFYTFTKFEEIHNRVKERNSKGTPKELQRDTPDKDKEVDKNKIKSKSITLSNFSFLKNDLFLKTWNEYLEMRIKNRKPATEKAKELVLKKLHEFSLEVAIKMLEQSIVGSWQSVWPLKEKENKFSQPSQSQVRKEPKANKDCDVCKGTGKIKMTDKTEAQCFCVV